MGSATIIYVNFFVVTYLDVSCFVKFSAAEDGLVGKCGDHVNCASWLSNWVMQFLYISSCMAAAISDSENFGRRLACLDERIAYFSCVISAVCVTCC